jgi:hypothetical protein
MALPDKRYFSVASQHRFGAKDFENVEAFYCCNSKSLAEAR